MRKTLLSGLVAILCFGASLTNSIAASDQADCKGEDLGARLVACTRLIESGKLVDKDLAMALNNRGMGYVITGDLDRGLGDFDRALALDASLAVAYLNRGYAYAFKQSFSSADRDFRKAMKVKPNWAGPYIGRSLARFMNGELDGAIEDLTTAIKIDPNDAQAYVSRGSVYRRQGKIAEAVADFKAALKIDPQIDFAREHIQELLGDPDAWEIHPSGLQSDTTALILNGDTMQCILRRQTISQSGYTCLYRQRYALR